MKTCFLALMIVIVVLLFSHGTTYAQIRTEYEIQIMGDRSAIWLVRQTGVDVRVTNNTIAQFESKIASLVDAAGGETNRSMTASVTSIKITPSGPYTVVEYRFQWLNFSIIENHRITIGDVFLVREFFLQLYGDGEIIVSYPQEYILEAVTPAPYEHNITLQTLIWLGTMTFVEGQPAILLREESASSGVMDFLGQNSLSIAAAFVAGGGFSAALYVARRHRNKRNGFKMKPEMPLFPSIQTDEEKIAQLLKSSGGSMHQSAIAEQCKFSKAKTSQLLSSLESKRVVSRVKKGRDKIVVLMRQGGTDGGREM